MFFTDHCKKRSNTRSQAPGASSPGASLLEGLHWEHPPLKQRLTEVSGFRQQHENLRGVLQTVLSDDDRSAVVEVSAEVRVSPAVGQAVAMFDGTRVALDALSCSVPALLQAK